MAIAAADEAWDSDWSSSPHDPRAAADRIVAMGPDIVRELVGSLRGRRRAWVLYILEKLGPSAASAAPHLEARHDAARALWAVDELRARALGVHVHPETRQEIANLVGEDGFPATAIHLARLLEAGAPDVVEFALESRQLATLTDRRPELVPVDLIQAHAELPAARRVLAKLRLDPHGALAQLVRKERSVSLNELFWVGPLEHSDGLVPLVGDSLPYLIERRRAAGLETDEDAAIDLIRRNARIAMAGDAPLAANVAAQTAFQLPTLGTVRELAPLLRRDPGPAAWKHLVDAFGLLDERTRITALSAMPSCERKNWVARELLTWQPAGMTTAHADALLLAGKVEDWLLGSAAYQHYAAVLLRGPDAYAALQLAWIDRGFGTPIEKRRIAWLRGLGVHDDALLGQLESPVVGLRDRGRHTGDTYPEDRQYVAEAAEAAELPSIAMLYWRGARRPEDAVRTRVEAQELVRRLRAACG